jgi:transposase-like protein
MDPILAKFIALLSQEPRGRGWRVPTALKQLGAQWARSRLAGGERLTTVARALGVKSATLGRWLDSSEKDSTKRTSTQLVNNRGTQRAGAGAVKKCAGSPLALRAVRIADNPLNEQAGPHVARQPGATMRLLLFEDIDATTLLQITQAYLSSRAPPC